MFVQRYYLGVLLLALGLAGCAQAPEHELSNEDLVAMKEATAAYHAAWLSGAADSVMATFVEEPVLSPSGMPYLEGQKAARNFWWPEDSPPTMVTQFEFEDLEASGSGNLGYVRGLYTLNFEYDGKAYTNVGKFLHILRRDVEGQWRISHHFWNDLPQTASQ